jgi:predicted DNA-binding transcriptional regulator AlpA
VSELLTLSDLGAALGLTPAYVRDRIVKRADFPRPALSISQKNRRWSRGDFDGWLKRQAKLQSR